MSTIPAKAMIRAGIGGLNFGGNKSFSYAGAPGTTGTALGAGGGGDSGRGIFREGER